MEIVTEEVNTSTKKDIQEYALFDSAEVEIFLTNMKNRANTDLSVVCKDKRRIRYILICSNQNDRKDRYDYHGTRK